MEKYLAALLLATSMSVSAKTVKGTIPIICTDEETFAETITEFEETPLLTAMSSRDMGEGLFIPSALVIFVNTKTGTFTIAEKIDDMYCAVSVGENMKPYVDKEEQQKYKGT